MHEGDEEEERPSHERGGPAVAAARPVQRRVQPRPRVPGGARPVRHGLALVRRLHHRIGRVQLHFPDVRKYLILVLSHRQLISHVRLCI